MKTHSVTFFLALNNSSGRSREKLLVAPAAVVVAAIPVLVNVVVKSRIRRHLEHSTLFLFQSSDSFRYPHLFR